MFSTQHQDITDWQEASLPFIHHHLLLPPPPPPPPPHTSEYNNNLDDSTHDYVYDHDDNEPHHLGITLPPILPLQPSNGTNNTNQQSSSSTQPPGGGVKPPNTSSSLLSLRTQPRIPKFNENLAAQQLVSTLTGGPVKKGGGGGGVASNNNNNTASIGTAGTKAPRHSGVDTTNTNNNNNNNNSIHRGLLLLRLPKPAQKHFDRLPAAVCDPSGQPCLLVLPSDKPASRQEAIAVEQFVSRSMGTPSRAAETAALWRRKLLSEKCGAAMTTLRQDSPVGWFVKQNSEKCGGTNSTNNSNSNSQKRGSSIGRTSTTATTTTGSSSGFQKKTKTARASHLDTISEVSSPTTTTTTTTTSGTLTPFSPICSTKAPSLLSTTTSRLSSLGTGTTTALLLGNNDTTSAMGWAGTCRGSMTAALTVAMAEVIRQVEVGCAERARVLIKLWNAMLEVTDGAMKEGMEADGVRVMRENAVLSAEVATLRGDVRDVMELQLQVARLEREVEGLRRRGEEEEEERERGEEGGV